MFQAYVVINRLTHKKENKYTVTFRIEIAMIYICKRIEIPAQACYRPRGFQEAEAPRFGDSRHMKAVRLSALRTGRHYPSPRKYSWYSFLLEAKSAPGP
jgi:hypothetical protein